MSIIEKGKMRITTQVLDPPTEKISIPPTKDAYLSQENPLFSYGDLEELTVKNSKTICEKSLLTFFVPAIDEVDFANIKKVSLNFHVAQYLRRKVKIDLRYHEDDGWDENGTTWAGQPLEHPEIIKTIEVNPGDSDFSFDIKDLFKNSTEGVKYAFTISESADDGEQDIALRLHSKEYKRKDLIPTISYVYEYFPDNYDANDFSADFTVARVIPNDSEPAPDLPATMYVRSTNVSVDLNGT